MDPSASIAATIAVGAAVKLREDSAGTRVDAAYLLIRSFLFSNYPAIDLDRLEHRPTSIASRASVAEDLADTGADSDSRLLDLVQTLAEAIQIDAPDAPSTLGVDIEAVRHLKPLSPVRAFLAFVTARLRLARLIRQGSRSLAPISAKARARKRPLLRVLGVLVLFVSVTALAVVLPPHLIDSGGVKDAAQRLTAENNLRTTLLGIVGGAAVFAGSAVAYLNFRETQRHNQKLVDVQIRTQLADRFVKAIDQLGQQGDDKVNIRIGAIYMLEQIARDSTELRVPVVELLASFLRGFAGVPAGVPLSNRKLAGDLAAAIAVLGRRRTTLKATMTTVTLVDTNADFLMMPDEYLGELVMMSCDMPQTDMRATVVGKTAIDGSSFRKANMVGAVLRRANIRTTSLRDADLTGTDFQMASLDDIDLRGATLVAAGLSQAALRAVKLDDADMRIVDLRGARLDACRLPDVDLRGAYMSDALMRDVDLQGATLAGADLQGARLDRVNLTRTDLRGADLRDAFLQDCRFEGAQMRDARLDGTRLVGAGSGGLTINQLQETLGHENATLSSSLQVLPVDEAPADGH